MDTKECILSRRSVRQFVDKEISQEIIKDIVRQAQFAPSWKNSQTVRYIAVCDKDVKNEIAKNCVNGFEWNTGIIGRANVLMVEVTINNISGYNPDGTPTSDKGSHWQSFDAGLNAQTFCLAAHNLGVGSVILGIFNENKIKEVLNLDEKYSISALIPLGYYDELPQNPPRKELDEVLSFV